ncbi:LysE family translocator [Shewanella sp. SR44-3]|uniref:LysE family translocator n=1 Tax=unclassified Shewanella TaxID=196818 RepID=UPI0015FD38BD|nr:LysE family translocator [Shewanella sp. SR44-3]MBB1269949.1 LysE family translocator [Shewanella sp. SR44-3]
MDLSLLWTIGIIHLVALVSPGPDFAIVVKLASQQSRSVALACAAGISVAILAHTILSLTGVSLLIQSSNYAYVLMQLVGASYLGWMGIGALTSALKSLKNKPNNLTAPTSDMVQASDAAVFDKLSQGAMPSGPGPQMMSNQQGFLKGLYTNLLNPKALVFFMTLFSVLITPEVNQSTKAAAALLLFGLSFSWFGCLAIMLTKERVKQHLIRLTPAIDTVVGLLFTSVALAILYQVLSTQRFV